ncbi:MAG: protein-ADP-ribose hydrolase [Acutalibacteraceae bacterium]|jgi:O-acetyl-ADP-ribose deacetylase (regulator of RNase III)
MTQAQRRRYLIDALLAERRGYPPIAVPEDENDRRELLRALMNVRPAAPADEAFLAVQDAYLRQAIAENGITDFAALTPIRDDLYLWRGDITTLRCDAIVNAANAGLTGCYRPGHRCVDNCIHTFAGIQLRQFCAGLMEAQGHEEPTGGAKITPAFNLPCRYVIHTVGPIVGGPLTDRHRAQLRSCYDACLRLADENGCACVAFCCISTGVFGFPQKEAAAIAVDTVSAYKTRTGSPIKVIFNVFLEEDEALYRALLA